MQDPDSRGEHRRRDQPARRDVGRPLAALRVPELRPRPVVHRLGVEDHVRDHPVGPLAAQQRAHLGSRSFRIDPREADDDERRVPVPLPRVEPLRRLDEVAGVVPPEDGERLVGEAHVSASQRARLRGERAGSCGRTGSRAPARRPACAAAGDRGTSASRSSTTSRPSSQSASCTRPARCGERTTPGALRIGCSGSSGSAGKTSIAARKRPASDELGQRLEVDDVRAAHEHEHGVRPHELEQLAGEQRLVLARRRREHEDDARGLDEASRAPGSTPSCRRYASVSHGS